MRFVFGSNLESVDSSNLFPVEPSSPLMRVLKIKGKFQNKSTYNKSRIIQTF